MNTRVLVVDDSSFFRKRVTEMLNADPRIEVVGSANNGEEAITKTKELKPDVITMDIEMPVMDGITAVKKIMAALPTPILMFSSLTTEGANATFEALEAGAVDYLPKRFDDISKDREDAKQLLCSRVKLIASRRGQTSSSPVQAQKRDVTPVKKPLFKKKTVKGNYKLVAIGTSTGGPIALQEVLTKLPKDFPSPIILIQHMPGSFTGAFAGRLNTLCKIDVKEAEDGDSLLPGHAYLAPGGKQMELIQRGREIIIRITDPKPGQTYKPCVDITFSSASKAYPGKVLSVILTGMGADGREGARALKSTGSVVWSQDEASSVIYGMPAAVAEAGLTDNVLPLTMIAENLIQSV